MSFNIRHTQKQGNNKFKEGWYILQNPKKYIGLDEKIWCRSKYEYDAYEIFDTEPTILRWCAESEQVKIPYYCRIDGSFHHYYPDAYVEAKAKNDSIIKFVFEIKPQAKLKHPGKLVARPTEKQRKTYARKAKEYARIMDKKEAAEKWCAERGYRFEFMTEKFLYKK